MLVEQDGSDGIIRVSVHAPSKLPRSCHNYTAVVPTKAWSLPDTMLMER